VPDNYPTPTLGMAAEGPANLSTLTGRLLAGLLEASELVDSIVSNGPAESEKDATAAPGWTVTDLNTISVTQNLSNSLSQLNRLLDRLRGLKEMIGTL